MPKQKKLDTAAILRAALDTAAAFEATMTPEERIAKSLRKKPEDRGPSMAYVTAEREEAMSDFETLAAIDALETVADDIRAVMDSRMDKVYRQALDVYYVMEELVRDPEHPEHAELVAQIENMRRAHVKDFGRPIPPKKKE